MRTSSPGGITLGTGLQITFWLLFTTFILYLSTEVIGWPRSLYRTIFLSGCHIINFYTFYSWIIPKYYDQRKFSQMFASVFAVLVLLTSLRYYIETHLTVSTASIRLRPPGRIVFIIFTEVSIAGFAALLRLAVNNEQSKNKILELERVHLDAELRFLKAQTSPHFLFNTINNIYSLALIKSDKAPSALMKMASLLRYLLYESHQKVPLQREVEAIESYVSLFQLKYQSPVTFEFHKIGIQTEKTIEPMLLIPLLENAFKHSGVGVVMGSFVNVQMKGNADSLTVKIENSIFRHQKNVEAGGIGLPNIQKRLALVYPDRHTLTISEHHNFIAELTIPYE